MAFLLPQVSRKTFLAGAGIILTSVGGLTIHNFSVNTESTNHIATISREERELSSQLRESRTERSDVRRSVRERVYSRRIGRQNVARINRRDVRNVRASQNTVRACKRKVMKIHNSPFKVTQRFFTLDWNNPGPYPEGSVSSEHVSEVFSDFSNDSNSDNNGEND